MSQTHKIPHTALIAAANGLVRVMAMVPGVAQSKYRFTFKAKTEPSIILRHWPCDLNMRKSVEHAGFTLALLSPHNISHHLSLRGDLLPVAKDYMYHGLKSETCTIEKNSFCIYFSAAMIHSTSKLSEVAVDRS